MSVALRDPVIGQLLGASLALLFATAGLHKLRDLRQFTEVLLAYRLPLPGAAHVAPLIPLLELSVAAGLLLPYSRSAAALAGAVLLMAYAGAIALNLGRGRVDLACGCGAADDAQPIAPWMVGRNLLLALALWAVAAIAWGKRDLAAGDWITLGGALPVVALLYLTFDRLQGRVARQGALLEQLP